MSVSKEARERIKATDHNALMKPRDSRAAQNRPPAVPAKAKAAIAILLQQPEADLTSAAKSAGLTVQRLKVYLKSPHVRKYFVSERQVILDAVCAGNPAALKDIRDNAENSMARVSAVKGLEAMRDDTDKQAGSRAGQIAPGVVIVIEQRDGTQTTLGRPQPQVIEHEPIDEDLAD